MDVAILRVRSTKNRIIMHYSREQTDMITSSNNAKVKTGRAVADEGEGTA